MILADTSIWIDHLRAGDRVLANLLEAGRIVTHPFVIGELALGRLRGRDIVLAALAEMPRAIVASDPEVLSFINAKTLFGLGIGYVDAHLLASARLTAGGSLWTRDKRLLAAADQLNLAAPLSALPKP